MNELLFIGHKYIQVETYICSPINTIRSCTFTTV